MNRILRATISFATALLLLSAVRLEALDPGMLEEAIRHALGEVPGALVVEVGIEEGWDGPIADVELGDGGAVYVALTERGPVTIGREQKPPDRDLRRIVERIEELEESLLPITAVYRIVLDSGRSGPDDLEIEVTDLYEIEYEIEYGRLVLEVTFRRQADEFGGSEITLYVDPRDGRILAVERDD